MTTDISDVAKAAASQADEESIALLASAEAFTITTPPEYEASAGLLRDVKAKQKDHNTLRVSITRPLDEAKAGIMELFKPAGERLVKAEVGIKNAMLGFNREQQRLRQEAQRRLDEQAAKEREKLRNQAEAARDKGKDDRATELEQRADSVPTLEVTTSAPEVAGVSVRVTWHAEVRDLLALVKAVAEGKQPLSLLEPNMTQLNGLARTMKGDLAIPGVAAVSEEGIAARA